MPKLKQFDTEQLNIKKPKNKKTKDMVNLKIDVSKLIKLLD